MTPCGATLAASHQEPTETQAWFQAFDMRGKKNVILSALGPWRQNLGMEKLGLRSQVLMTWWHPLPFTV